MATDTVSVDNPYGLQALWAQGDFIAKGVLVLLVLMSAYSWFIIFTKWWEQRRMLGQANEAEKNFWAADNIKNGVTKLTGKGNIFKAIASEAIDSAEHHDSRMTQQVPLHEWIDNVIARGVARIASALQIMLQVGAKPAGLTEAMHQVLVARQQDLSAEDLLRMLKLAGEAEATIRRSGNVRLAVETLVDHLQGKLYIDYLESMDELLPVGRGDDDDESAASSEARATALA